jgi:hypothetical protein
MAQWHGVVTNIKDVLFLNPGIYSVTTEVAYYKGNVNKLMLFLICN